VDRRGFDRMIQQQGHVLLEILDHGRGILKEVADEVILLFYDQVRKLRRRPGSDPTNDDCSW